MAKVVNDGSGLSHISMESYLNYTIDLREMVAHNISGLDAKIDDVCYLSIKKEIDFLQSSLELVVNRINNEIVTTAGKKIQESDPVPLTVYIGRMTISPSNKSGENTNVWNKLNKQVKNTSLKVADVLTGRKYLSLMFIIKINDTEHLCGSISIGDDKQYFGYGLFTDETESIGIIVNYSIKYICEKTSMADDISELLERNIIPSGSVLLS